MSKTKNTPKQASRHLTGINCIAGFEDVPEVYQYIGAWCWQVKCRVSLATIGQAICARQVENNVNL